LDQIGSLIDIVIVDLTRADLLPWSCATQGFVVSCRNPSLGLATKARACKVASQEGSQRSHLMLPGVQESVREWILTLPKQFSLGELESRWTPKSIRGNCRGQNPLDWKKIYIIGKLLKHRCLKWDRITHLDIWNTSYGQKKGRESNWQFDSRPLKVGNRPNFLVCKGRVTYHWKAFNEGYNFVSDFISIQSLHTKLWAPKVAGVPILAILRLPFGSPRTKCHLDVGLVERHKVYYKGKGGGFPQIRALVNLVSPSLLVARPSTKSAPTMH